MVKKTTTKKKFPLRVVDSSHPTKEVPGREDNQNSFLALCREFLTDQEIQEAAQEGTALHKEAMKKPGKKAEK